MCVFLLCTKQNQIIIPNKTSPPITIPAILPAGTVACVGGSSTDIDVFIEEGDVVSAGKASPGLNIMVEFLAKASCVSNVSLLI